MKKINSSTIRYSILVLFLALILLNSFVVKIHCGKIEISEKNTSIVFADSLFKNKEEIIEHTNVILSILNQRVANTTSELAVQEDITMQFRLFYAAIVVGLFSFLFKENEMGTDKDNKKSIKSEDFTQKKTPYKWALLSVIVLMYLLELHRFDLITRSQQAQILHNDTIEIIANKKVENLVWYDLNNKSLLCKLIEVNDTRWKRKIAAFFRPEVDQIIIYFVPLMILLFLWNSSVRKK